MINISSSFIHRAIVLRDVSKTLHITTLRPEYLSDSEHPEEILASLMGYSVNSVLSTSDYISMNSAEGNGFGAGIVMNSRNASKDMAYKAILQMCTEPYLYGSWIESFYVPGYRPKTAKKAIYLKLKLDAYDAYEVNRLNHMESILSYQIPFGQSPETKSTSLKDILNNVRFAALAPCGAGALYSAQQIGSGELVLALGTAAVGAGASIIIISSVCIMQHILFMAESRRNINDDS